ncbi:(2Fe-2S)-binding protein [Robbsia sp. KACC 23696]|uniref:(2Fe-2S)-binding protein n=1 Tax=Robbsia sp. KACC 23696 TaxID=3149231 RepID=UPI00325B2128
MREDRPDARAWPRPQRLFVRVNGTGQDVDVVPETPLLYVLRNDFALNGPKYGCGLGQCGACTVLLDGAAVRSCVLPVKATIGRDVRTLEGLPALWQSSTQGDDAIAAAIDAPMAGVDTEVDGDAGIDPARLHPVQRAFIEEQAAQCGYCLNGMICSTVSLLSRSPDPDDAEIRSALRFNLCRCGCHVEVMRAVKRAAVYLKQAAR